MVLSSCTSEQQNVDSYRPLELYPYVENIDSLKVALDQLTRDSPEKLDKMIHLKYNLVLQQLKNDSTYIDEMTRLFYRFPSPHTQAHLNYLVGHINFFKNGELSHKKLMEALHIYQVYKDTMGLIRCYNNLKNLSTDYGNKYSGFNMDLSQRYNEKIKDLTRKSNKPVLKTAYLSRLLDDQLNADDPNLEASEKILKDYEKILDGHLELEFLRFFLYNQMAVIYSKKKLLQKELEYNVKSLHCKKNVLKYLSYSNIAGTKVKLGQVDSSLFYLIKSEQNYIETQPSSSQFLRGLYNEYAKTYIKLKDYKKAIFYDHKKDSLEQIVFTKLRNKTILEAETFYKTQEKELINQQLMSDNRSIKLYMFTALLFVVILSFILYAYVNLAKSQKASMLFKDNLLKTLSHDINGPLTVVNKILPIIMEKYESGQTTQAKDLAVRSQLSLSKITSLVDDIIVFLLHPKPSDKMENFKATLEDIMIYLEINDFGLNNVSLDTKGNTDFEMDSTRMKYLQIILRNILANILRHAYPKEIIIISTNQSGEVHLEIRDDGQPLTTEVSEYYQIDNTKGRLGMYLIRSFTKLLGGKIEAQYNGQYNCIQVSFKC